MRNSIPTIKTAVAIRHIHFECLGTFESILRAQGYQIHYIDIGTRDLSALDPLDSDLLVVLGGPIGVYEEDLYPYLAEEREILKKRLNANLPTLGICLGAQQIAKTLGAEVKRGGYKEIGFSVLSLSNAGKESPLRHLDGIPVMHWHGDQFEIPEGASSLASTKICPNQAFSIGKNILALQFHPEVDTSVGIESWLTGHAVELAVSKVDPRKLREETSALGAELRDAGRKMFEEWMKGHEL